MVSYRNFFWRHSRREKEDQPILFYLLERMQWKKIVKSSITHLVVSAAWSEFFAPSFWRISSITTGKYPLRSLFWTSMLSYQDMNYDTIREHFNLWCFDFFWEPNRNISGFLGISWVDQKLDNGSQLLLELLQVQSWSRLKYFLGQ